MSKLQIPGGVASVEPQDNLVGDISGSGNTGPSRDDNPTPSSHLTYTYRLRPRKAQHRALETILEGQRLLYNAALEERIGAYRKAGKSITFFDQCKSLTIWRHEDPAAGVLPVNLHRWSIARLNDAYQAFFKRVKKGGGKAGFPRFRGKDYWTTFGFKEFVGIRFDGKALRFKGVPGALRLNMHRPLPADARILCCTFTKDSTGWCVGLNIETSSAPRRALRRGVGIDPGARTLLTLSDGRVFENPRLRREAQAEIRRKSRKLARAKKGSKGRQKARAALARAHRKVADARKTYLNQVSAAVVRDYDFIGVEKTEVKGLIEKPYQAGPLHDAAIAELLRLVKYKALREGAVFVEVKAAGTSQDCSGCGAHVPKAPAAQHSCPACGLTLDRDVNAAHNILRRAVAGR